MVGFRFSGLQSLHIVLPCLEKIKGLLVATCKIKDYKLGRSSAVNKYGTVTNKEVGTNSNMRLGSKKNAWLYS